MNEELGYRGRAVLSFDDFYTAEIASLLALAAALTGTRDAARDLAQEALLRAFRSWDHVSRLDRPGAWARRVLINLSVDVHRRSKRESRAIARLARGANSVFGEPELDEFWRVVRDLPMRQRAVVVLRYVDDLSVESIAEVLGVSAGTVTKSLFVARQALARRLKTEEDQGW